MHFIHLLNGKQFSLVALVAFLASRRATGLLLFRFRHLRTRGEITWISADCSRQFELKRVIQAGKP